MPYTIVAMMKAVVRIYRLSWDTPLASGRWVSQCYNTLDFLCSIQTALFQSCERSLIYVDIEFRQPDGHPWTALQRLSAGPLPSLHTTAFSFAICCCNAQSSPSWSIPAVPPSCRYVSIPLSSASKRCKVALQGSYDPRGLHVPVLREIQYIIFILGN